MEIEDEEEISLKKPLNFPKRYISIGMACFLSFTLTGTQDLILDVMEWFVNIPLTRESDYCNATGNSSAIERANRYEALYGWDLSLLQDLKMGYSLGSITTQLIGGVVSDKYGTRKLVLIMFLISTGWLSVCPLVIRYCAGISKLLVAWATIYGIIQGPSMAAIDAFLGQWVTPGSRTLAVSLKNTSGFIGLLVRVLMAEFLAGDTGDYAYCFYIWSGMGLIMCFMWFCLSFSSPEDYSTITDEEKTMFREALGPYVSFQKKQIPWKKILLSLPVWAYIVNHAGLYWAMWTVIHSQMPSYLQNIVKIDFDENFLYISLVPAVLMILFNPMCAAVSDYLSRNQIVEISAIRKIYANFGCMGSGIFAVAILYADCNQNLIMGMFSITLLFLSIYQTGINANNLDFAPNFAGVVEGIAITFGTATTVVGLLFSSVVEEDIHVTYYQKCFWISLGLYTVANIFYALTCSGKEHEWNIPPHLKRTDASVTGLE